MPQTLERCALLLLGLVAGFLSFHVPSAVRGRLRRSLVVVGGSGSGSDADSGSGSDGSAASSGAIPLSSADLARLYTTVTSHEVSHHEASNVCVEAKTGALLFLQQPSSTLFDSAVAPTTFRAPEGLSLSFRRVPASELASTGAVYWRDRTLWAVAVRRFHVDHFAHFAAQFGGPLVASQHLHLRSEEERRRTVLSVNVVDPYEANYVTSITSAITHDGQPVSLYKPNTTECFARAHVGFHDWMAYVGNRLRSPLFDMGVNSRTPYMHAFRLRLWALEAAHRAAAEKAAAEVPYLLRLLRPPLPIGGDGGSGKGGGDEATRVMRVALTIRGVEKDGFGRNVTNAGELVQYVEAEEGLRMRAELVVVQWTEWTWQQQMSVARGVDVLMGVHGNNLAWLVVMKPQSVLVELFPHWKVTRDGVNLYNAGDNGILTFLAKQLSLTTLHWTAAPGDSPLASPEEYKGKTMAHRCKSKSSRQWMCRNMRLPVAEFRRLVEAALARVGRFEKDQHPTVGGWLPS